METELRYALTPHEYQKLMSTFRTQFETIHHLQNSYFDDPRKHLRSRRISLRIRTIQGSKHAVLTLKYPPPKKFRSGPRALKVRNEFECSIPIPTARAILTRKIRIASLKVRPIQILRTLIKEDDLWAISSVGSLFTVRAVLPLPFIGKLELDCCTLFGKRFYELEVETKTAVVTDQRLRAWLAYCGINATPAGISKSGRFFQELAKR